MKYIQRSIRSMFLLILLLALAMPTGLVAAAPQGQSVTVQPAAAAGMVTLTIDNRTGGVISSMELKGPKKYIFTNITPGVSKREVVKGKYNVSYQLICGQKAKTKINLSKNGTLYTTECTKAEITFENKTSAPIELTLTGGKVYTILLPVGKSKFTIFRGLYRYRASTSCGVKNGRYTFTSNRIMWIFKCK